MWRLDRALESVYKAVLEKLLLDQGFKVSRQRIIPIKVMGLSFGEGFKADLIIEDLLLIIVNGNQNFVSSGEPKPEKLTPNGNDL